MSASGPEAQDALFTDKATQSGSSFKAVPRELARASLRLQYPPSYALIGAYRLCTDKNLRVPAWDKCRHATRRGLVVGAIWAVLTFELQKKFIEVFLANSPRVTGLSKNTVFGLKIPFDLHTYAAILLIGLQVTWLLKFFLSKNIRIARERAWAQTVASRGKGPDFWQPYVEEWENPPYIAEKGQKELILRKLYSGRLGRRVLKFMLLPFDLYPFIGILISAWLKALGTAQYLHRPYFETKKMTQEQIDVFIEERKWDYRIFGFTAALLEGFPIIGLIFSISNRIGAAMWAHDLEKIQHYVRSKQQKEQ
ncbi:hypothetical protein AMATHDRAFT_68228 [Amanita thiersii Skay4041]|uniref:Uncharacterized protein n=1 Tax=Amanita thiersii Skay4041 TaxID=703135 RepID=A0A2A9NG24_9AGAR|nr:hypothetical protein AMATHDRAFT_68228 [Amanita thiersii Skay4041]